MKTIFKWLVLFLGFLERKSKVFLETDECFSKFASTNNNGLLHKRNEEVKRLLQVKMSCLVS